MLQDRVWINLPKHSSNLISFNFLFFLYFFFVFFFLLPSFTLFVFAWFAYVALYSIIFISIFLSFTYFFCNLSFLSSFPIFSYTSCFLPRSSRTAGAAPSPRDKTPEIMNKLINPAPWLRPFNQKYSELLSHYWPQDSQIAHGPPPVLN